MIFSVSSSSKLCFLDKQALPVATEFGTNCCTLIFSIISITHLEDGACATVHVEVRGKLWSPFCFHCGSQGSNAGKLLTGWDYSGEPLC